MGRKRGRSAFSTAVSLQFPDKLRQPSENDEHWERRKIFLLHHRGKFSEDRLACLSQVYANVHFLGCSYPEAVMEKITKLEREMESDFDPQAATEDRNSLQKGKHRLNETDSFQHKTFNKFIKGEHQSRFAQRTDGTENLKPEVNPTSKVKNSKENMSVSEISPENIPEQFEPFSRLITFLGERETNPLQLIHICASKLHMKTSCSYEMIRDKDPFLFTCSLYINDYLVSGGSGSSKKDSQKDAYTKAVEKLSLNAQSNDSILKSLKNATINTSGNFTGNKCNEIDSHDLHNIVILDENQSNSNEDALGMLQRTSYFNRVPMNFKYEEDSSDDSKITCHIEFGKSILGTATGSTKDDARFSAADMALVKLKEKAYTVKVKENAVQNIITKEKLKECMSKKSVEKDSTRDSLLLLMGWKDNKQNTTGRPDNPHQKAGLNAVDPKESFISQIKTIIANYASSSTDEDLVFTSDLTKDERKEINRLSYKYSLKYTKLGTGEDLRAVISRNFISPSRLLEHLIIAGGETAKHLLILPNKNS